MSEAKRCPICDQGLLAHAEVTSMGVETFVASCSLCGRYALGPEEMVLARNMADGDRYNLMALLEVKSIPAEADGTVVLKPLHFVKGWR